jgi:hypothetical protein
MLSYGYASISGIKLLGWIMGRLARAALFAWLSLVVLVPTHRGVAAPLEIYESPGRYLFVNNSATIDVYGFLVGNSFSDITSTTRPGWDSAIITQEQWDNGGQFLPRPGAIVGSEFYLDTTILQPFSTYFGSDSHVNAYYRSSYSGDPIGPGSLDDRFTWAQVFISSQGLAFGPGQNNLLEVTVSETPIPGALPLFATGLGFLGWLSARRKKRLAAHSVS